MILNNTLSSIFICFFTAMLHAQAPAIQWQKSFGGSGVEEASAVTQTSDGGYLTVGFTQSNDGDISGNHGGKDVWIVKTDSSGIIQWQKALGGSSDDVASALTKTSDGGYIFVGYTRSNNGNVSGNHGLEDAWVVKLDAMGIIKWQHVLGGSLSDKATSVQTTKDGGCIVAGFMGSHDVSGLSNKGESDGWILKLTAEGSIEWQKTIGGSGLDVFYSIQQTADGGFIAGGNTSSSDGDLNGGNANQNNYEGLAVKFDTAGNIEWHKTLGGSGEEVVYSILQSQDGGYFMSGYTVSTDIPRYHGNCDLWVARLDLAGNSIWQKALGGTLIDQGFYSLLCDNGDYIVAGFTGANDGDVEGNHGNCDFWMLRINDNGDIKWQKTMGGTLLDRATCIAKTNDNGYVLAGYTWSSDGDITKNHGNDDFWIVKLLPEKNLSTATFKREAMVLFPNPAKSYVTVRFPDGIKPESIIVYDILGKIVMNHNGDENLEIEKLQTGQYFVEASFAGHLYGKTFIKK